MGTTQVPATLLTGFLGAGKTTVLDRWLREPALAGTAVIVNEFGEAGLDAALVVEAQATAVSLLNGCICCGARGDLAAAVVDLAERRRRGLIRFDRVVIETTGLADPGPVLAALMRDAAVVAVAELVSVVTVVSAQDGDEVLDRFPEARRQVALADRILLSKTDLPGGEARAEALAPRIRSLNPSASIAVSCAIEGAAALSPPSLGATRPSAATEPVRRHATDAAIEAVRLVAGAVDRPRLALFCDLLAARLGTALLRTKGLVLLADEPDRPLVLQAVGAIVSPARRLPRWPGRPATELVVIVDGADPRAVTDLWDDLFGPPRIDRPDARALGDLRDGSPGLF